jgi:cell division protein FtsI/penicillin-binding protein 2
MTFVLPRLFLGRLQNVPCIHSTNRNLAERRLTLDKWGIGLSYVGMPFDPWRGGLNRRRNQLALLGLTVVIAAIAVVVVIAAKGSKKTDPGASLRAFANAWSSGHPENGPLTDSTGVAASYRALTAGLASPAPKVGVIGAITRTAGKSGDATGRLHVQWTVDGRTPFAYDTSVHLTRAAAGKDWKVVWSPATVHPGLVVGDTLQSGDVPAARAVITGAGGSALVSEQPVVHVGIEPSRVKDLPTLAARLAELLQIDAKDLTARVKASTPHAFVDVITLRRPAYEALAEQLQPLPGTVFQTDEQMLAPTRTFARALLGTVGPVTADLLKTQPGRFRVGQLVGLSGLQKQYEQQLGGTPGVKVVLHHKVKPAAGAADVTLLTVAAKPGTPVATTIDPVVQQAADNALAGEAKPSALIAVQVSTGKVLAVANGPGGGSYDLGLTAQVPPGSTFKVVSTLALLEGGLDPATLVNCTPLATVDGRTFHNAEQESFGPVPFSVDFARSCNTAFVSLAPRLGPSSLATAAQSLGIGVPLKLGVPAYAGSVPVTTAAVDKAASIFGQGRILLSPVAVALSTATVARGTRLTPQLVVGASTSQAAPQTLPAAPLATLRTLMRDVVTSGTGTALAGVPGAPVYGKTGTAEHGSGPNPPSHAWFTGWQGDIAFCVFVQDGEFGGDTAAPIAARFLTSLG